MSSSPSLPVIMILKSSYYHTDRRGGEQTPFCVLHCTERGSYKNIHLCNEEDFASPHAKFELVRVDPGNALYYIKCCYNNRFWTVGADQGLIQATEKDAAANATVFKFEPVENDNKQYRLTYKNKQDSGEKYYVCFNLLGLGTESFSEWVLQGISENERQDSQDVFTVVNWESLVILPKEIAFKGNNGKYVYAMTDRKDYYYFRVVSDDIGDREIANQIVPLFDRTVAIYNSFRGKYWTFDDSSYRHGGSRIYMVPQSDDTSKEESQFVMIKVDRDVIAFRNVKIGTYCIWSWRGDYFLASDDLDATITDIAKFQVEELVVSRKVFNVDFRFDDSFFYDDSVVARRSDYYPNRLDTAVQGDLKLEYEAVQSTSYDTGVSVKTISGFSLEATVPIVEDALSFAAGAEYTDEKENRYSWGQATEKKSKISIVLTVTVPPETKVTAEMEVRQAKCDVPFSYTQRDITTKGEHIVRRKEDGVYSCTNCYNYSIVINEAAMTTTLMV